MKIKKNKTERRIAYEKLRNFKNNNIPKKNKFMFEKAFIDNKVFIESWNLLKNNLKTESKKI